MPGYKLKCHEVRPLLSAYLDRELPIWKIGFVRLHLLGCSDCAREVAELQSASLALKNWVDVRAPSSMLDSVMMAVRHDSDPLAYRIPSLRRRFARLLIPIAATIVTLVWFLAFPFLSQPPNDVKSNRTAESISVEMVSETELLRLLGKGRS
jgi:anti-sigma factor RsiW